MNKHIATLLATGIFLASPLAFAADIAFDKGKVSKTISAGVERGKEAEYTLTAKEGQPMTVAVTSLEDNAVFQIEYQGKDGKWAAVKGAEPGADTKAWYGELPASAKNKYRIVVGATRGNTAYDLFVGLPAVAP